VLPHLGRPLGEAERRLFARVPLAQRAQRLAVYARRELLGLGFRHPRLMELLQLVSRRHMEASVADPELRRRLTPNYTLGCKRILMSNDYYPAIVQPNVELVTAGVAEVRPNAVLGADGVERPVDTIIFGTGFQVNDLPFAHHVFRGDGRSLADAWGGSPQAHLGTTVAGFPNLFILQGPGTGLGHSSVLLMIEAQIAHLVGAVRYMGRHQIAAIEPRAAAQAAFVAEVDRQMERTVWTTGGCQSWYLDRTGRNSTIWPGSIGSFRRRVSRFGPREYVMARAAVV
jgi:cation diffusion facilitator CzcD-associated flavoprotein CzcO